MFPIQIRHLFSVTWTVFLFHGRDRIWIRIQPLHAEQSNIQFAVNPNYFHVQICQQFFDVLIHNQDLRFSPDPDLYILTSDPRIRTWIRTTNFLIRYISFLWLVFCQQFSVKSIRKSLNMITWAGWILKSGYFLPEQYKIQFFWWKENKKQEIRFKIWKALKQQRNTQGRMFKVTFIQQTWNAVLNV